MSNQKIKLNEADYRKLYDGYISKALRTEHEVMTEYSEREQELLYKFIGFTYQILSTVGIIAGFGFTAINKVTYFYFFIVGEMLLISSILFGLRWLKEFYETNLAVIQDSSNKIFNLYKKRDEILIKISNQYLETQTLSSKDLKDTLKKDEEIRNFIAQRSTKRKKDKNPLPHKHILTLSIVGFIFILLSFLIKNISLSFI